jgi:G3E family GTPase
LVEIELGNKKKDLADMAISLSQKKEWATELNQHLQIIESSKGNKRSRELIKLKNNVRSQIYVNKQTDLLRENIDALSAEYYEKLREKFPSLTKTELKLCSFIRLKLTIAQIADFQNIDTASVIVGRYRLKKNLELDTDQNLDEFLQLF